jgi:hypothetical protein
MKRNAMSLAAIAALVFGGAAQAIPTQMESNQKTIEIQSKQTLPKHQRSNRREILPDGTGGVVIPWIDHGRSPKEYGQMLQFNRRQKWIKSRL